MGRKSKFDSSFKSKVAIEAVKEQRTPQEIAKEFNVSPSKVREWKTEFLQNANKAFETQSTDGKELKKTKAELDRAYKALGQAKIERDFLRKPARAFNEKGEGKAGGKTSGWTVKVQMLQNVGSITLQPCILS